MGDCVSVSESVTQSESDVAALVAATVAAAPVLSLERVAETANLFPLPVSSMERYFLDISTPARPMSVVADVIFEGPLDRERYAAAFQQTVDRHPLARAIIDRSGPRPVWRESPVRPQVVFQRGEGPPDDLARFDLATEPGFRLVVVEGKQVSFSFQAHHAVCDGQGLRQLSWDTMLAYDRSFDDSPRAVGALPRLDESLLLTRGNPTAPIKTTPLDGKERLKNLVDFFRVKITPLRREPAADNHDGTFILRRTLPVEATSAFKAKLARENLSPNDACLTLLFELVARWNGQGRWWNRARNYRILVPVDLRVVADARLPATNRLGFAFLTRTTAQCGDFASLSESVRGEMTYIKDRGIGADFLHTLAAAETCWWLMRRVSLSGRYGPTVLFSDLGDATRRFRRLTGSDGGHPTTGELHLQGYFGASPLPPGTGMSICLGRYTDRYFFSFVSSPRMLGPEAAGRFADRFLDAITKWAAS